MMKTTKFFAALAMAVFFTTSLARAGTETKSTAPTPEQMADVMKTGQPSEGHKKLEPFVGKWNHTMTYWMEPGGQPQTSKGTNENTWVMGGRYLQQSAHGEAQGQMPAFEGEGLTGFDNIKGEYNTVWIDNMSTGMTKGTSSYDGKTKTFNETGTFTCPIEKKTISYRATWTVKNKNAYKYTMFVTDANGKEYKSMEIAYSRAN